MFESPDDLIAESHSWVVTIIDSRSLTVIATNEIFVKKVNANVCRKELIQLGNLHKMLHRIY